MKIAIEVSEVEREVVALIYCSHFVMRGTDGKAVYLTSDNAAHPPPNTAFVHEDDTFEDLLNDTYEKRVIHKGDKVTLQF